jgi:phosphatidylserine decarboxylase
MSEVLLPMDHFKSFNEFFYRALKPDARPCSAPDNPKIIVSPADSRSVVFNTMEDATRIWVKGREYSMERLLGDAYPMDAKRYKGGALGIFRLAPQDYHRFHVPVDGVMGTPKTIEGEYYTVNPMAIRSALDVYGDNVRVVVPIDSVAHGRVMYICIGAMMVGSTVITRRPGEKIKRAEELGYFKFGGSTILLLFEPGVMVFDDDLIENSNGALETLVSLDVELRRPVLIVDRFVLVCQLAMTRNLVLTHLICAKVRRTSPWRIGKRLSVGSREAWHQRLMAMEYNEVTAVLCHSLPRFGALNS